MEAWFSEHSHLIEAIGIVGSLLGVAGSFLFSAYTTRRDELARKVTYRFGLKQEHREIWSAAYAHPELWRVTEEHVDLASTPITFPEGLLVNFLIQNLDAVYDAMQSDMYFKIEGLEADIRNFFSLPIPKAVWAKLKKYQNVEFVKFVEATLR